MKCPECDGEGKVIIDPEYTYEEFNLDTCETCNGTGKIDKRTTQKENFIGERTDNPLEGGEGDDTPFDSISAKELVMGIKVEMEHIGENEDMTEAEKISVATDIAMDHLANTPDYYTKLKTIIDDVDEDYPNPKLGLVEEGIDDTLNESYYPDDYSKAAYGMTKKATMAINFLPTFFGRWGSQDFMTQIKEMKLTSKIKSLKNLVEYINTPDNDDQSITVEGLLKLVDGIDTTKLLETNAKGQQHMPSKGFSYREANGIAGYILFHMSKDDFSVLESKHKKLYDSLIKLDLISR